MTTTNGQTIEKPSEEFRNVSCKIPTSSSKRLPTSGATYESVAIDHSGGLPFHGKDVFLIAWAILLKAYTGSELVSFVTTTGSLDLDCSGVPGPANSIRHHLTHCQVRDDACTRDVYVTESPWPGQGKPLDRLVNTAVQIWHHGTNGAEKNNQSANAQGSSLDSCHEESDDDCYMKALRGRSPYEMQ
ncbi:MAG: hypothetical protein L6R41_000585 [Letrouitia leprolyta]|nr:MAG: hypothetical protein L6R41_000585 [Letrouitia leprolyta]